MTDVLKIALDRRAELHEEIDKLDDFIRMAESLIRASQQRDTRSQPEEMPRRPAQVAEPEIRTAIRRSESSDDEQNGPVQRPQVIRRGATAING